MSKPSPLPRAVAVAAVLAVLALSRVLAADAAPAAPAGLADKIDFTRYLPEWTSHEVAGVAFWKFILSFLFVLAGLAFRKISDHILEQRLIPFLAAKTRSNYDEMIARAASKPLGALFLLAGLVAGVMVLPLPAEPDIRSVAAGVFKALFAADVLWFMFRIVDVGVHYLSSLAARTESKLDDQLVPLLRKALKATTALVWFVWLVQLLGYSVSSLLAGLGIGGLAVALGLQETLSNFFGSVVILLDRPFKVGDWVQLEGVEGVIEDIGFRSTRIRTFQGTLVSVPNQKVATTTIDNCSKMPKRRVMHSIGLTYETTPEQMEQAVEMIRSLILADEGVDSNLVVVRFSEFGNFSLNITVLYFTKAIIFAEHLTTRERLNLAIMRALNAMGVSIAFPTQTLYLEGRQAPQMPLAASPAEARSVPSITLPPGPIRPAADGSGA